MSDKNQQLLVCGGTFDPPHRAHVILPGLAALKLGCSQLIYIPAAVNPLKTAHPPASGRDRIRMLELLLLEEPPKVAWEINAMEIERGGPSFTVDTLEALALQHAPGTKVHFVIGADAAIEFRRWKRWPRILELATPAVLLRPPWTRASLIAHLVEWNPAERERWAEWIVDGLPLLDESASDVRADVAAGRWKEVTRAVGPAVAGFIRANHLYGAVG